MQTDALQRRTPAWVRLYFLDGKMRRILEVVRHLHRQRAAWGQHLDETHQQYLVIVHPLEGGIADDQVNRRVWRPRREVGQHKVKPSWNRQRFRLGQHLRALASRSKKGRERSSE